jgi:hypothetical protein
VNIFILDSNIKECAQAHCDKHVVKMILEYTQILCTVADSLGYQVPYKPTHQKHPCTLWTAKSTGNWLWLKELCFELNNEYQFRFSRSEPHKSFLVASALPDISLPEIGMTEHAQAMPDECKERGDAITAYRRYYLAHKSHLLKYTKRKPPAWIETS